MNEDALAVQIFPHSELPLSQFQRTQPFIFTPLELSISPGQVYGIGRKIDKAKPVPRPITREDRATNNVTMIPFGTEEKPSISFRSKVVSRSHAQIWAGKDGLLYFRDVGSSSGTFINRLRLSPSNKESRAYPLNSGDIIQLGVDYQGRQEEIYKAVMLKVFIKRQSGQLGVKTNRKRDILLIQTN
jgi:pSer/pThr/pTyr-binding forkhead associated (FHA) protein